MDLFSTDILQLYTLNMVQETLFKRIDDESSILLGTIHMFGNIFPTENRGCQSSTIAVVAIVIATLYAPSIWTRNVINRILKYGDILHTQCTRLSQSGSRTLSPNELLKTFVIGDAKARIRLYRNVIAGIILEHDLASALKLFFANNSFGIIHTANFAIPIMKHWSKFYFLDPSNRNGFKDLFENSACLIKCENITKMSKVLVQVCAFKKPVAYTLNAVQILDLNFFTQ